MIALLYILQANGLNDLAERETEALILAVVGMAVVFTALVLIGLFITALGKLAERLGERTTVETDAVPSAHGMPLTASEHLDPRMLAVITAAVVAAVGKPVRVHRVTFINRNTISAWTEVGRMSIQSSHKMKRSL